MWHGIYVYGDDPVAPNIVLGMLYHCYSLLGVVKYIAGIEVWWTMPSAPILDPSAIVLAWLRSRTASQASFHAGTKTSMAGVILIPTSHAHITVSVNMISCYINIYHDVSWYIMHTVIVLNYDICSSIMRSCSSLSRGQQNDMNMFEFWRLRHHH